MESKIIGGLISRREVYEGLASSNFDTDGLSTVGKLLIEELQEYYKNDGDATEVDLELFKAMLKVKYEHHYHTLETALSVAHNCTSIPNVVNYLFKLRMEAIGLKLATELTRNVVDLEKSTVLATQYLEENDKGIGEVGEDLFSYKGACYLADRRKEIKPVKLYPAALNAYLDGGVSRQNSILLFGRPEAGKSALAMTIATGFMRQGLKTLYLGNEDPEDVMRERIMCCLIGKNRYEIREDPPQADAEAMDAGYSELCFVHRSPGTLSDLRSLADKVKPDCIIVDQIGNIGVNKQVDKNKIERLTAAVQGLRNIAQQHNCVAVGVTQAGNSAHKKNVLEMNDVDFSNTGMQAHVDLMVGIGANDTLEQAGQRMLSFPKNKINGQHGFIPCKINQALNRITGV